MTEQQITRKNGKKIKSKFVIHQSELDSKWYVRIVAGNGETWFVSEGYDSQSNAERSVTDFQNAMTEGTFTETGTHAIVLQDMPVEILGA